jgi:PAS domain S-box-containing protein
MTAASIARVGQSLCFGGAALGALGLFGWLSGTRFATTIVPGLPPMTPNTALALMLIGAAGVARRRGEAGWIQKTLSLLATLLVLIFAVATLAEYGFAVDLDIDRLLIPNETVTHSVRPSPTTALALTLLAAALLLFNARPASRVRPSEWLVFCAALTAFTALTGIILGAEPLYRLTRAPIIGVSLPTAISLLLTSTGLLLERPAAGVMRVATSPGPGGILLRRLTLPIVVVPVVLAFVVTHVAALQTVEDISIAVAVLVAALTASGLVMVVATATPLDRAHAQLVASRAQTRSLLEQAPDGIVVADLDGRYIDINDAGCRILGRSRDEIIGRTFVEFMPPEDVPRLWQEREFLRGGGTNVGEWRTRRKDGRDVPVEVSARILPDGRWQAVFRDISERKRLEEQAESARAQLAESEERFRLAIDEAPIGMALIALDGRFIRVNRALCEIVGYSAEELTGLTFHDITHADDLHVDLALAGQLHRGEIPRYQLEKRYFRKDGTIVQVMLSRSILRDRSGEPICYIAQVEDITARKRLEEELRVSEAKSSGIISMSADAIISVDAEQRISQFNEGAEKIFGYSKTEAVGAPLDILIPERLRAAHRKHVSGFAASSGRARRMGRREVPIVGRRKNGEEFPADAAISMLDVSGTRVLTVVLRDVTEQKRIENEQRFLAEIGPALASTLDYEETLSCIAEIPVRRLSDLCILDLVDETGEIRRLKVASRNPAHAWIRDAFLRVPLDPRGPHLVRSALESRQPVLIQHPAPEDVEALAQHVEHRRTFNALALQSIMVIPLLAHGRVLGAMSFLSVTPSQIFEPEDVSVANQLAERAALAIENARLYSAARRAIQVRDEVLGIVAHDLRNPLAAILLEAALLRRQAAALDRESSESVEAIRGAATRMNRLIEDLLDVTRLEAGRLPIEPSRLAPARVAADAIELHRALASSRGLELRLNHPVDLPDVWADRDRLLQVFDNLIGNAVKFTQSRGRITVAAVPRDSDVLFSVADSGPGIPREDHPHLFDRFWQARATGRSGAGLGLPIVKGIVDAHCGSVWMESAPGRGSTFFFTIPTADYMSRASASPARRQTAFEAPHGFGRPA